MDMDTNSNLLKLIKTNARYQGNEDLCDDFLAEASKRAFAVASNFDDISFIEPYLRKVVNTAILIVLKNSGRVVRVKNEYEKSPLLSEAFVVSKVQEQSSDVTEFSIDMLPDVNSDFEESIDNRNLLEQICSVVLVAETNNLNKNYYNIFVKRYIELKKQSVIADELGISQSEVCKRLHELVEIIKKEVSEY